MMGSDIGTSTFLRIHQGQEIYLGDARNVRMCTVFENFVFCELAGGIDLNVCLGKKCSSYAMSERIGDDCNDNTLVVEMSHRTYILGLFRIGCDADAGIRERLTEIYLQGPARRDRHTTGNNVYLTLLERRYELLKFVNRKGGLDAHVGCDLPGDLKSRIQSIRRISS